MPYRGAHFYEGKRVMVTGGLGFIGSNLARQLVDLGSQVLLVDSMVDETGANRHNIDDIEDRVSTRVVDVRDALAMERLVAGQDVIFNLAGQVSHIDSMHDPFTDLDINCRAQLSLLEACRRTNPGVKIVFASTRQIYGRPHYLPVDEKHPLQPVDVNGINKLAGEQYHLLYSAVHGIRSSVLRLTNTIGPRMRVKDARQTFVGTWIRQALADESFEVWGGEQLRDFTYVDDAVEAFLLAAVRPEAVGHVFNLGGRGRISLAELAELLVKVTGTGCAKVRAYPTDRRKIDIGDFYADGRLIARRLGWRPQTTIRDALAKTVAYYRTELPHYL
jgi:UDP-glucose 4-epimerase